jgi:hypothetical protein
MSGAEIETVGEKKFAGNRTVAMLATVASLIQSDKKVASLMASPSRGAPVEK